MGAVPSPRRCVMRRRRVRDVVRVRVPNEQAPLFHVPGPYGGWFASLLYGFGTSIDVPVPGLRKLLADSRGEVIIARRLTAPSRNCFSVSGGTPTRGCMHVSSSRRRSGSGVPGVGTSSPAPGGGQRSHASQQRDRAAQLPWPISRMAPSRYRAAGQKRSAWVRPVGAERLARTAWRRDVTQELQEGARAARRDPVRR